MADAESLAPLTLNRTRLLASMLDVSGVLLAVAVLAWCIHELWQLSQAPQPSYSRFLSTLVVLVAGLAAGLLLWGLAELLRRQEALYQNAAPRSPATDASAPSPAAPRMEASGVASAGGSAASLDELVCLMREIRDISMLDEEQRRLRLELQGQDLARRLAQDVPGLLREHDWVEGRRRVQQARERFPTRSEWDVLDQQIEQARAAQESRDIELATREVAELSKLGAWDRVGGVLRDLLERHPDAPRAQELAQRVRAERDKAEAEQRARLMVQAQAASSARDWRAALAAANTLIHRFPTSTEAEALRVQMPTLRENAEIQTRHALESEFRDLIRAQRFGEALRIARQVIDQYPESPQAQFFREQLPKLEARVGLAGPGF